jgi:hypothetical protein
MSHRRCKAIAHGGGPCQAPPLRDEDYCRMHSPAHAEAVADARRVGGQRRRREATVATAYDFEGFNSIEQIGRFLEIAAFDALSLDVSVPRVRAMTAIALAAAQLLEKGELADRLAAIEAVLMPRIARERRR